MNDDELERALRDGLHHEAELTEIPDRYDSVRYAATQRRPRTWITGVAVAAALAVGFGGTILGQTLLQTATGTPVPAGAATDATTVQSSRSSGTTQPTGRATATVTVTVTVAPGAGSGFDQFPVGYDHAYLSKLEQVNGRWAVVLDPLTVCRSSTDKPECAGLVDPIPNDSTTVNVSLKTYRVPLAPNVVVQVLDGGAPPTKKPYLPLSLAARRWDTPIEVVIAMSPDNEVTSIRQFWRP